MKQNLKVSYLLIAYIIVLLLTTTLFLLPDIAVVHAATPEVTTDNATSITTNSAILNGELTSLDGSANVTVSFQWGTSSSSYDNETTLQTKEQIGSFSATISSLSSGITYHFRAKVTAPSDNISYGEDKTFTTLSPPAVTTNAATDITSTGATLNGNLTSKGSTTDNVTVRFQYGKTTTYSEYTDYQAMPTTGTFSASISNLESGTTYHFRTMATAIGVSISYGVDKTFTPGAASVAVTTSDATDITSTGATLKGNLTDLGGADDVAVSFEWGTSTSYGNETTSQTKTSTGSYTADIRGLSPGTAYHFRAKVVGDDTKYGSDKTFTAGTNPLSVSTSAATNVTTNSATLNGNLSSLGTDDSITVSFEWGNTQGGPYPNQTATQTETTTGTFSNNLTGLNPDTTYYFKAKAVGENIIYGTELSFQTNALAVPPPDDEAASSFFGDLSWPIIALIGGCVLVAIILFFMFKPKTSASAVKQQEPAPQPPQQPQRTFTCPRCGSQNAIGQQFCSICGETFQYNCPQCGAIITPGSPACPYCGMGMDWGT